MEEEKRIVYIKQIFYINYLVDQTKEEINKLKDINTIHQNYKYKHLDHLTESQYLDLIFTARKNLSDLKIELRELKERTLKTMEEKNTIKVSDAIAEFKNKEKDMDKNNKQFRLYFTDKQLKNIKEMPIMELNDKGKWTQQVSSDGKPLTETRCIVDIPDTAYLMDKEGNKVSAKGYNLIMRNKFYRAEHDNGYYCLINSKDKYSLVKVQPFKDKDGNLQKNSKGQVMYDFDHKKVYFVSGKVLVKMMESWKEKEQEKKPLDLNECKKQAAEYNNSRENQKDTPKHNKER